MKTTYDANETFYGESLTTFRNICRLWDRWYLRSRGLEKLIDMNKVESKRGALLLLEEADRQKLFANFYINRETGEEEYGDRELGYEYGMTRKGQIFVESSSQLPMSVKHIDTMIKNLIERVANLSNDKNLFFEVEKMWLFGESLTGESTDIDIALSITVEPEYARMSYGQKFDHLFDLSDQYPDILINSFLEKASSWYKFDDFAIIERFLFGTRANNRFSFTDEATLVRLGYPCRLLYDVNKTKVDDNVLPHHPKSSKTGKISKKKMPLFSLEEIPKPITPEFCRIHPVKLDSRYGNVMNFQREPSPMFISTEEAEPTFSFWSSSEDYREISEWIDLHDEKVTNSTRFLSIQSFDLPNTDLRSQKKTMRKSIGMIITREFERTREECEIDFNIESTYSSTIPDDEKERCADIMVALLVTTNDMDVEKVIRHAEEFGKKKLTITLNIQTEDFSDTTLNILNKSIPIIEFGMINKIRDHKNKIELDINVNNMIDTNKPVASHTNSL